MRRGLIVVVLAVLPLPAVAWASAHVADRAGAVLGAGVGRLVALLPRPAAGFESAPSGTQRRGGVVDDVEAAPERPGAVRVRRRVRWRVMHGVHVSVPVVLRLAESGTRPRGTYVPSDGVRRGGLRLTGVSRLGIGLRDGDVLTRVAGAPARSAGDVVSAVVAARGRRAPAVSGIFWRGHVPYRLIVDQPYVQRARIVTR